MWLCVGLGNPGRRYDRTRHNVGFAVIDRLSEAHGITLNRRLLYSHGRGTIGLQEIALAKPLVFMNRSGLAVQSLLSKYHVSPDHLIIVHDDLDLAPGVLKIRRQGSSGGHRGVESVIHAIGTPGFVRLKIGIGRDPDMAPEEYVLRRFSPREREVVAEAAGRACEAVEVMITEGLDRAMNIYNQSSVTTKEQVPRDDR